MNFTGTNEMKTNYLMTSSNADKIFSYKEVLEANQVITMYLPPGTHTSTYQLVYVLSLLLSEAC